MKFYLGTDRGHWLWNEQFVDVPLFVSHRTLVKRKTKFPRATTAWALDSGGFSELDLHGKWVTSPESYIEGVRRYVEELGSLDWASPQDWMCEPWMLDKTGLSMIEHQERTVENYLLLREMAPDLPFIPVLQGWELDDYLHCFELYRYMGVDLTALPTVGIGSVCRRQSTAEIGLMVTTLAELGLPLHGFGVKSAGIKKYGHLLASADSMAWSFGGRRAGKTEGCTSKAMHCGHCPHYALDWRERVLSNLSVKV